jgi:hypothetical protein
MFEFYGAEITNLLTSFEIGGVCPHCKQAGKFVRLTTPIVGHISHHKMHETVADYGCIICRKNIPILWTIVDIKGNDLLVAIPRSLVPAREPFDFDHVPELVRKEIEEALDCLSVNAFHSFAAVCRRAIQAIAVNLGAGASTKIEKQIDEMIELSGLDDEWKELAKQIMLSGHDGSHPHLPDMDMERSKIPVSLLQDLTYQLYTRPGKVKAAAELRILATKKQERSREKGARRHRFVV